jgi:hypothetical protein
MAGGNRPRAAVAVAVTVIAVFHGLWLGAAGASGAGSACAEAVLRDWSDGRIDRLYEPACYLQAIEILPEDVRAYTSAADDIRRALQASQRDVSGVGSAFVEPAATEPAIADDGSLRAVPPAIVALVSVALAVLLAGTVGLGMRRLRVRRRA